MHYRNLHLHWYGARGIRWEGFKPSFDAIIRTELKTTWLIIQFGSNDWSIIQSKEIIVLSDQTGYIETQCSFLCFKISYGVHGILPRRYWHFADEHSAAEKTRGKGEG